MSPPVRRMEIPTVLTRRARDIVTYLKSTISDRFTGKTHRRCAFWRGTDPASPVSPPKSFPGMAESTFLSRSFADQGVKLRIRKEPRTLM